MSIADRTKWTQSWLKIVDYFAKLPSNSSEEAKRSARNLVAADLITLGLLSLLVLAGSRRYGFMPLLPSLCLFAAIPLFLKLSGQYVISAHLVVFSQVQTLGTLIFYFGGFKALSIFALPLVVVSANILLPPRHALSWTLISIVMALSLCFIHKYNDLSYFTYATPDEREFFIGLSAALLPIASQFMMGHYYTIQRRLEKKLAVKNEELGSALSAKKHLVSILSHDINNALTIIMSTSEMESRAKGSDAWERVERASRGAFDIITQVREAEALERGKKSLRLGAVDMNWIMSEVLFTFDAKLKKKHLELVFDNKCGNRLVLSDSRSLLNSVVNNVISNAVKFSPKGGRIIVEFYEEAYELVLSVSDGGEGIALDRISTLFDGSAVTSTEGTMGETGTGFGLPIVKAFMESYGGRVAVDSSPRGTTFYLFFQVAQEGGERSVS